MAAAADYARLGLPELEELCSAQCWIVYFIYSHRSDAYDGYEGGTPTHVPPHLTTDIPPNTHPLALIKRMTQLDSLLPLSMQLHLLKLFDGEETPYESLHAVVSCGVEAWFDAFVGTKGQGKTRKGRWRWRSQVGNTDDEETSAELELRLLHLHQNVEMPETNLVVHPVTQRALE